MVLALSARPTILPFGFLMVQQQLHRSHTLPARLPHQQLGGFPPFRLKLSPTDHSLKLRMRLKLNGTRSRGFPTPLTPYDPVFSNLLLRVLRKSLTSFEFAKAAQNENRQKRRLNILNLLAKKLLPGDGRS